MNLDSILEQQPVLLEVLKAVFEGSYMKDPIEHAKNLCNLRLRVNKISHWKHGEGFEIIISQMYDYVDFSFSTLKKLSELFGTDKIDVNNWSLGGCETCDFGSSYKVEFEIYGATKNIPMECSSS